MDGIGSVLLAAASRAGYRIKAAGDELQIQKLNGEPASQADEQFVKLVEKHKTAIISHLAAPPDDANLKPVNAREAERFKAFPTDALPVPLCDFVSRGAKAIGCDDSFVALPLLSALAAAIGNTRRVRLKRGWSAPAIIWTAIVGESGTSKTPAFKLVMRPIRERQRKAMQSHSEAMNDYKTERACFDKEVAQWKKSKDSDDPPLEPESPICERVIVSDTTVEALAPILLDNPRGLLLARDELAGWIGSFDRYAGGKGGDSSHWLSIHNGENIIVDRKTGVPRTIYVPRATVSVCGGIQPGILHRALGKEHRESGLAARLLLACPPRRAKRWTEADIDPAAEAGLARLLDRLYSLRPTNDDDGNPRAVTLGLTPEAKSVWVEYYNAHALEQAELSGDLAAAWGKLEEYAARLALVINMARWAAGGADPDAVDAESMRAGIELTNWFKGEARRVYAVLGESDGDREQRRLLEWITERKGGSVSARELQQGQRQYRTAADAEAALDALVAAGCGHWQTITAGPGGGRPTRRFTLSTSTKPSESRELLSFVDVDTVDTPETASRVRLTI